MKTLSLSLFLLAATLTGAFAQTPKNAVQARLLEKGELAPLPEAKPLLVELGGVIDSNTLKDAIAKSRTLQMMRERVRTSLFHINFKFDVVDEKYPYDPPFEAPFPFRPTIEALDEAARFFAIAEKHTGFKTELSAKIAAFPHFQDLKVLLPKAEPQPAAVAITQEEMGKKPVDSYVTFMDRKDRFGEVASFPEFQTAVDGVIEALQSEEVEGYKKQDAAFADYVNDALRELRAVQAANGGSGTRLQGKFTAPYPYRRTIQAVERAVLVLDVRERLKYKEGVNWHDVELSWYHGDSPKLLALYHFNRYKYQMAGMLAEHEQMLLPFWGGVKCEYLIRTRVAPLGILEISPKTERLDRHHNSPTDGLMHDANHNRRMFGYDKRKAQKRGAVTRAQKIEMYREQEKFVQDLLSKLTLDPSLPEAEIETRKQVIMIIFETFHETALTADADSILQDMLRLPATPQPFEVQAQVPIGNLEDIRTFDGNLKSGADQLSLNLNQPTTIRYFYDRAPGFLANVDNKLRWGFYDSVFKMGRYITKAKFRTPQRLAIAATRLFGLLGHPAPELKALTKQMTDHSGQQELWNYFGVRERGILKVSGLNALQLSVPNEIHDTWRRNSLYPDRWKPTNAKLLDGTIVRDERSMKLYFQEKGIPEYLHDHYQLGVDPYSGETILFEDLRNLGNEMLANNHQTENLMSGAKANAIVDRIWQYDLRFADLDDVERWLIAAVQAIHQAVLDRNANGSRNNPVYNQHWLLLPSVNQVNDLEVLRIAFEKRVLEQTRTKQIPKERITMVTEGIMRLFRKIRTGQPMRTCNFLMSQQRNLMLEEQAAAKK